MALANSDEEIRPIEDEEVRGLDLEGYILDMERRKEIIRAVGNADENTVRVFLIMTFIYTDSMLAFIADHPEVTAHEALVNLGALINQGVENALGEITNVLAEQ